MTIGDIIDDWVDRQRYDLRDAGNFTKETLRGNDETIGRRAFGKSVVTLLAGGGAGGYTLNDRLEEDESRPDDSGRDSNNGGGSGNSGNGDWDSGSADRDDVESIYEILDDSGDIDIEIAVDWANDGVKKMGYDVEDIYMGQSGNEYFLDFRGTSDSELRLPLEEEQGYSNSEVETLRNYDDRGLLDEVFRPAIK